MENHFRIRIIFYLLSFSAIILILHWRVFNYEIGGIHAWRQSQTQQYILNFYRYDPNILNPRINVLDRQMIPSIYRYEFPVFEWMIAMAFHITGDSVLVTRILVFLLGLCSIGGMHYWLRQLFPDGIVPFAGAWAFTFSPVFFYYTMNPLPDNLALCGAIWSMAFFFRFLNTKSLYPVVGSAVSISLAIASKLPYIIFLAAPGMWWIWSLFHKKFNEVKKEMLTSLIYLILIAPALWWYAWVIPTWRNGVTTGIFQNTIPWEAIFNILNYHAKQMFPKILLGYAAIPFMGVAVWGVLRKKPWQDIRFWWLTGMSGSVLLYWIFEFNMIGIVHDYYMMPFVPVLYLLVAYGIHLAYAAGRKIRWMATGLLITMPFITTIMTWDNWSVKYIPEFADVYNHREELRKAAPPQSRCIILNDRSNYIFSYLVDKQGYVFDHDYLPGGWVDDMIKHYGITYMYSNSRIVEADPEVNQYFDQLVMECGNVRVFKLKE